MSLAATSTTLDESKRAEDGGMVPESAKAEDVVATEDADRIKPKVYQTGWRLHMLTAGYGISCALNDLLNHNANNLLTGRDRICMSLLLSTLETTIVSTSLVSIVNDLKGFGQSGWVVTAYMLTYTGRYL